MRAALNGLSLSPRKKLCVHSRARGLADGDSSVTTGERDSPRWGGFAGDVSVEGARRKGRGGGWASANEVAFEADTCSTSRVAGGANGEDDSLVASPQDCLGDLHLDSEIGDQESFAQRVSQCQHVTIDPTVDTISQMAHAGQMSVRPGVSSDTFALVVYRNPQTVISESMLRAARLWQQQYEGGEDAKQDGTRVSFGEMEYSHQRAVNSSARVELLSDEEDAMQL